jgi:hypothetical protein
MAKRSIQQWAEPRMFKPLDISMTMRAISSRVPGLILEHIPGDKTLKAKYNELPEFLTALILDGRGSDPS